MNSLPRYTGPPRPVSLESVLIELDRRKCAESFAFFVKQAWHVVEPAKALKWGWALDAICIHLEAVSRGDILRLLMNVPPGMMKSLLVGVFFPAWEWGPRHLPHLRYLGTAHKEPLAIRDNRKCRMLIQSRWYQDRWPLKLTTDQNEKRKFENDATGFREAMAFTSLTGSRGDRVLLDDPISADGANSEEQLDAADIVFREQLPSRVNDDDSAIIVIMQRLHARDTSGIIIEGGFDYTILILPMRFEEERRCRTPFFTDPRVKEGELLFPERFPEPEVKKLETILGIYATAGQLQQSPSPRDGGLFQPGYFNEIDYMPDDVLFWVRGWDFAATTKKRSDRTGSVKIGLRRNGRLLIADAQASKMTPGKVRKQMVLLGAADNKVGDTSIAYPQDPGQAGVDQKQNIAAALAGFSFKSSPESGDKTVRATPLASQAEAGLVDILKGAWNKAYIEEMCMFPGGPHDDLVDASSRAYNELARKERFDLESVGSGPKVMGETA